MKCPDCLTEHPPGGWPWEKFPTPVYWTLSDDGADVTCRECGRQGPMSQFYLTQIPCGHRLVIHKQCIDEQWLSISKNLGHYSK